MTDTLSSSAQKVQEVLSRQGFPFRVRELPASTRTAREAAVAVGCRVEQIAKSLIFRGTRTDAPILVIASGINRVNESKLADLVGEPVAKPDAEFVRAHTGFSIGGVPPVGHTNPIKTWLDEDLFQWNVIWAAAGTPNAVFELRPDDLQKLTNGKIAEIK